MSTPSDSSSWVADLVSDTSLWGITASAVFLVAYGAQRAVVDPVRVSDNEEEDKELTTVSRKMALLFPLAASVSLLTTYLLWTHIQMLLTLLYGMLGGWAFAQALCGPARLRLPLLPAWSARAAPSLAVGAGAVLVVFWVATGHWLTNDLLAGALCLFMLRALRLPSVRLGTLLFVGLLVYDVFWVFFSDRIFANNVMVAVATRESANPVNAAAERLSLPMPQLPSLSLPAKLVIPSPSSHYEYSMLGLGDIIVPGLLIAHNLAFDVKRHGAAALAIFGSVQRRHGYFLTSLSGYVLALLVAFVASRGYGVAQPALLYLVPAVLGATMLPALRRGDARNLWRGEDGADAGGILPSRV